MKVKNKSFNLKAIILSGAVALLYFFNFFHQARYGGIECDTWYHLSYVRELIETGVLPKSQQGYPLFFYVIALGVYIFKNYSISAFLFILIWAFGTNLIQIKFLKHFLPEFSERYILLAGSILSFIWPISSKAFSAFFSGNLFYEYWNGMLHVYLRSGTTAPYQSLTYLCSKPFAILSVYFFVRIFEESDVKKINKMIALFSAVFFLSAYSKPNFYQCFAPAGVIMTIVYFFTTQRKELKRCVEIAVAYLPATIWVLYSMSMKVQPIAFSPFEGINFFDDGTSIPVVLARAVVYVIFTLICLAVYRVKDKLMVLMLLTYLFGTLEWLMLIFPLEKGALDMMWGYDVSMYLLFAAAIISAAKLYDRFRCKLVYVIGNTILALHGIIGVLVFIFTWFGRWRDYLGIVIN